MRTYLEFCIANPKETRGADCLYFYIWKTHFIQIYVEIEQRALFQPLLFCFVCGKNT